MTRAVVVAIEKAPGGLFGWNVEVGAAKEFRFLKAPIEAVALADAGMKRAGVAREERTRVVALLYREINHRTRAEVTAEVVS